jgi:hypothetical protein
LDPISYQVYLNRQMCDNTQRSSDGLRISFKKETREKAERAGDIEDAGGGLDLNLMSEDMLGDSDSDFLSGGRNQQFENTWGDSPEDLVFELLDEDDGQEPGGEEPDHEHIDEEESAAIEFAPVECNEQSQTEQLKCSQKTAETLVADEAEGEQPRAKSGPPEAIPSDPQTRYGKAPAPEASGSSATAPPAARDERARVGCGSWNTLLDLSGGFLLAETSSFTDVAPETADVVEPELAPGLCDLLGEIVVGERESPAGRRLYALLSRFGSGVLRQCRSSRVKVLLLPVGESLRSHPSLAHGLAAGCVDAVYLKESRTVVLESEGLLVPAVSFQPALLYFAYAWDHVLGGDRFASLHSPAVRASFRACEEGRHRFADTLAATSPVQYFAQSVESFLGLDDCLEGLWSRSDLYDFDRSMYEYLDYLFARTNRGS